VLEEISSNQDGLTFFLEGLLVIASSFILALTTSSRATQAGWPNSPV
jgi:hypothetical protein